MGHGWRLWGSARWSGAWWLVTVAALVGTGCDPDIGEGDLAVENRTDKTITIFFGSAEDLDQSEVRGNLGHVRPGVRQAIAGMDGCSLSGFEARDPDGDVVARLPPLDRDEQDCRLTWVVTEEDSFTKPLGAD